MALKILQSGIQPLGQFDGYDNLTTTGASSIKGGEVCTLAGYSILGSDKAAFDASGADGYVGTTSKLRPVVTTTVSASSRPLFLADDGTAGYGTLFGQLVGSVAGKVVAGAQLGPHTSEGSGKITIWDKPGLYAVTLDAVDSTTIAPTVGPLDVGAALYGGPTGKLTTTANTLVVGRFVEFSTNGSLVTTPSFLVQSSPNVFTEAVFHFEVET